MGFFDIVTINMTSCAELEDEEDEQEEKYEDSPKEMIKLLSS